MSKQLSNSLIMIFLIVLTGNNFLYSQQTFDTVNLIGITVTEKKIILLNNFKEKKLDSSILHNYLTSSLSDLLSLQTSVFIKTYGQGGLSTASFRGTSSSHTAVVWDNIVLNTPMSGQLDFSQFPVFFIDDIKLIYGGGSLTCSSGGLGGNIKLENKIPVEKFKLNILQQIGSFSTYGSFFDVGFKIQNLYSRTRLMIKQSENNFPFKNNTKGNDEYPIEIRKDAAFKQYGMLQEFYYTLNSSDIFGFKIFVLQNNREIPQPIVVLPIEKNENQTNKDYHINLNWKHYKTKSKLETFAAYSKSLLDYTNKVANIISENKEKIFYSKIKYEYFINQKTTITTELSNDYVQINTNNYLSLKKRNQFSVFAGISKKIIENLSINAYFREELVNEALQPILPGLGIEYSLLKNKNLKIKSNFTKNYHLPSLNDLYWYPGGNDKLLPEEGFSVESGLSYELSRNKTLKSISEITFFHNNISNWILWQPDPVFRYWTPLNLKNVHTQGVEYSLSLIFQICKIKLNINADYAYTIAKNLKPINLNDLTINKQLIYTPIHTLNNGIKVEYENYFIYFVNQYIGKRYTNTSNTRYMPSYLLSELQMGINFPIKNQTLLFKFTINNLFDVDYQAIAWHPMPGRNFEFQLLYNFKLR